MFVLCISGYNQQIKQFSLNCDTVGKSKNNTLQKQPLESVELILIGKDADVIKEVFKNSNINKGEVRQSFFDLLKSNSNSSLTTEETYLTNSIKKGILGKPDTLTLTFTPTNFGTDETPFLVFSKDGKAFDTLFINKILKNKIDTPEPVKISVVTPEILNTVNGVETACQLCDMYAAPVLIDSRKDRKYSTDYIVIYDPSLKKDAYTICKHIFQSANDGKLKERYIKIGAMWFAPHVGSQIRFEVINQPLNKSLKLTVDEQDLFNTGSGQFASIITGLVASNIVTAIGGEGTGKTSDKKGPGSQDLVLNDPNKIIPEQLDQLATQILNYVIQFKISSCALQAHQANLAKIITNINTVFSIWATTTDQLSVQLKDKIELEITDQKIKVNALKEVEAIIAAFKMLENVQPIAFTTLRAKNRDFIEIKYTDANSVVSKPENIRMSGGMKIDFSGGFVLTGLRDYTYTLKDASFRYTPLSTTTERDTTGNVIIKEDDGNNQVGVGILTHFYPRMTSHYNIGGTVGLMTSTNLNLRLMLGGSVMISSLFGSNHRVSFSGGVVWGKVKRLSKQYEDFLEKPRTINGLPQFYAQSAAPAAIDRNEHSWFFAITMNFGGN